MRRHLLASVLSISFLACAVPSFADDMQNPLSAKPFHIHMDNGLNSSGPNAGHEASIEVTSTVRLNSKMQDVIWRESMNCMLKIDQATPGNPGTQTDAMFSAQFALCMNARFAHDHLATVHADASRDSDDLKNQ